MRLYEANGSVIVRRDEYMTHEKLVETWELIKEKCSPWLNATDYGEQTFYRGIQFNPKANVLIRPVRTDRKPLDTEPKFHDIANALIAAAGGTANRSNSIFITSSLGMASSYGMYTVVILPVGDFNYTWSPQWQDWYGALGLPSFMKTAAVFLKDNIKRKHLSIDPALEYEYQKKVKDAKNQLDSLQDKSDFRWANSLADYKELTSDYGKAQYFARHIDDRPDISLLTNPSNYDSQQVKNIITVDAGLHRASMNGAEVMVRCSEAMHIDRSLWELFQMVDAGKEITQSQLDELNKGL